MVSSPYQPRPKNIFSGVVGLCFRKPRFVLSYYFTGHFLVIFKLILIKESISLNAFIKKHLRFPIWPVWLPLPTLCAYLCITTPFGGGRLVKFTGLSRIYSGVCLLTYGDCALHCLFITGIYLSIISGITLKLPLLPKWSILNGCRVIAFNGLGLSYDSEWP